MKKKPTLLFILVLYIPILLGLSIYIADSLLWDTDNVYLNIDAKVENENTALLKETKDQLQSAYSAAKPEKVKEIIKLLENTVDKMTKDENYSYKDDAKVVKKKYDNLNPEEKNALKAAILNNMKFKTLLNLKDMFGL